MTAIGNGARFRLLLAGCALAVLATAGCGGSGSGSKAGANGGSASTESATNPPAESTGPESPGRTANGVSVSLPSLPVGGSASNPDDVRQCVSVSWTGSQIIEGATVRVTRIVVDHPEVFAVDASGCGSPNCAASFSFKPSATTCSVAVRAAGTHGATATLTMSGSAHCDTAHQDWCAQLKPAPGSISLTQPSGPPTEPTTSSPASPPSPSPVSPPTPTTTSSS